MLKSINNDNPAHHVSFNMEGVNEPTQFAVEGTHLKKQIKLFKKIKTSLNQSLNQNCHAYPQALTAGEQIWNFVEFLSPAHKIENL